MANQLNHQHKSSAPAYNYSSNLERSSPTRQSHSHPSSLNQDDQWQRNYKESVREYRPPNQPSLFLFGRDEFEKSEIVDSTVTPENTPIHPLKSGKDHVLSAPGSLHHHQEHEKSHEHTLNKNTWPYGLSSNEDLNPNSAMYSTPLKYSTLPKHSYFGQEQQSPNEHIKTVSKKSDPNLRYEKHPSNFNQVPINRRVSGSWPAMEHQPKVRYIYAYPEEVPQFIHHYNTKKQEPQVEKTHNHRSPPPLPPPHHTSPIEHNHKIHHSESEDDEKPSQNLFNSPAPEHTAHRSMIAELKARFQALNNRNENEVKEQVPHMHTNNKHSPRHSPIHQHNIPNDPPPKPPAHRQSPPNELQVKNSNPFGQIQQILQSNNTHILPVVERYLKSNFNNEDKAFDLAQFQESEVPLKYYWERLFRVSDGKKDATIKIENLLTIENGNQSSTHSSPLLNPHKSPKMSDELIKSHFVPQQKTQISPQSAFLSSEEAISWQKPPSENNSTYATVLTSTGSRPTKSTTIRSESDLLALVHRKIAKGIPLEWPELFLLKNSHCRWVIGREREFRRLANEPKNERAWRQLSTDLTHSYLQYQEILERARVIDDLYTDLAHSIMKAESFWYGARICADHSLRTSWYRSSIHLYKQLLAKARDCLPPNDRSLLTILDKLSMIMLESCQADPVTVQLCRSSIGSAEQALDMEINLKIERKLIKIKNNLIRIESNILR